MSSDSPELISETRSIPLRLGRFALFAVVIVLLGSELANISQATHPRFLNQADSVDSQLAILERRPFVFSGESGNFTSWRSRVLVPYAIKACSELTGLSFSQSYLLVRWGSALLALGAFALLVGRQVRPGYSFAALAAAILSLMLLPTFMHIYEIPSDFPDAGFFALLTLCALEKRRGLFVAVLLVALLNRESALFSLPVWFVIHGLPLRWRVSLIETVFCGFVGAVGVAMVLWLRVHFAVITIATPLAHGIPDAAQPLTLLSLPLAQVRGFLAHPHWGNALFFLFGYNVLFIALLAGNWSALPPAVRRVALVGGMIFLGSIPFANLPELRVYIPSLVLSTFALVVLLRQHLRTN